MNEALNIFAAVTDLAFALVVFYWLLRGLRWTARQAVKLLSK